MMTFARWMRKVDAAIEAAVGLRSDDLPDWAYRDAFDDELDPETAAAEALTAAGWEK